MIEASRFVESARAHGFHRYAGVPCSYLTPFINYVLQDPSLQYVSMANEGDAVAFMAGVALAGRGADKHGRGVAMMQNSGLGNAVSPLTSLTWTFQLPQLLIVTWRGQPGVPDEPQHALMGPITPVMLDTLQIAWELFPGEGTAIDAALDRATRHMDTTGLPYALLMQKGSVAPYALGEADGPLARRRPEAAALVDFEPVAPAARATRQQALRTVIEHTPIGSTVVIASTGFCGRELYAIEDRCNQLYMVGSMGCVTPLALGLAAQRPDLKVVALDGDGAALMRMGTFATMGTYGTPNLRHLLLDNAVHESTGGQATVSAQVSFAKIAAACGYASALETDSVARIASWLQSPPLDGAAFARLLIRRGTPEDLPRPSMTPLAVKARLMAHIARATGVH